LDQFTVPPENGGIARPGDKRKGFFRAVVDRGIESTNDLAQHARRDRENGAPIAAVSGMTDAIR
jgi:hypothetical protein